VVVTTGSPAAIASIRTFGNPSSSEHRSNMPAASRIAGTSSRRPRKTERVGVEPERARPLFPGGARRSVADDDAAQLRARARRARASASTKRSSALLRHEPRHEGHDRRTFRARRGSGAAPPPSIAFGTR
jgi:hypothetical protein